MAYHHYSDMPEGAVVEFSPNAPKQQAQYSDLPAGAIVESSPDAPAEQSWGEYLGGVAKSAAIPVAAGLAASRFIPGVGLVPTLVKAGIDVGAEGISQAMGLSEPSLLNLGLAAVPGPLVEGGRAVFQKGRQLLGHALPGASDILKGEAEKKALEAAKVLEPPVSSADLYRPLDAASQGVAVEFPKTLQEAKKVGQELEHRLYPPTEARQFARRAETALQIPGTPGTPAQAVNTGLLDAQGRPITRTTPGTSGTPARGISVDDALRNISDLGDDIRAAKRAGDNKLASDLTQQRVVMGEDFDASGLGAAHKAASRAFRQEQGAKEVNSIIENATKSEGGVDRMNIDRAINAIEKEVRGDPFFKGSFDTGKLEGVVDELRGLAVEVKKYSRRGELAFFGTVGGAGGYALGGPAGMMVGAAGSLAVPGLITEALGTPKGREFLRYLVKEGKGTVSAPLLKAFLQTGRVAANQGTEEEGVPSNP